MLSAMSPASPRAPWILSLVVGCAGAGVVSREEPPPPPQYPGTFGWSYGHGIASAEGARHPTPVDVPLPLDERLMRTRTALVDKPEALTAVVQFCVDVAGQTRSVALVDPGRDVQLNQVLLDTVRRWTFTPAELGGQRVEACSTATFVMKFE